ncbi:MAG: DUF3108 domain-containing protein [Gammaproteobacteria bacterium]|nr:DUF3108 domain-containing protein [Gammaproteobacteria bacterium]
MLNKCLMTHLLVAVVLITGTASAALPLPDFKASYELTRGSLKIGNSTIELSNGSDGTYTYKSHSWPVRWVAWFLKDKLFETSRGAITDAGIRPDYYHYQRTGGTKEREAKLAFDWERMVVENNVEDSPWEMDIPAGTIDKLVSQLGMMHALANGQHDITFNIADGGKLKEYRFKVVGEETLELPAGTFETVKVTKLRDNNKRETYIWCAPTLNYLPVRIWQREKDDSKYQSDLESFSDSLRIADKH